MTLRATCIFFWLERTLENPMTRSRRRSAARQKTLRMNVIWKGLSSTDISRPAIAMPQRQSRAPSIHAAARNGRCVRASDKEVAPAGVRERNPCNLSRSRQVSRIRGLAGSAAKLTYGHRPHGRSGLTAGEHRGHARGHRAERSGTLRHAMGCPRNSPAPVEALGPKPPAGSARGSDRAA